jgi:hypothetical protein
VGELKAIEKELEKLRRPKPPKGDGDGDSQPDLGLQGTGDDATSSGSGKTLKYAGLGIGAVGVISLGVAAFYGFRGASYVNEIGGATQWSDDLDQKFNDLPGIRTKFYIFSAVGISATLGGAVLFYIGHKKGKEPSESVSLVPQLGPENAGFALSGRF